MTGSRTSRLSPHAPRLEKLLLMLSTDRDGEVLSAARAIGRTLQTAGSDWHDLAGSLIAPAPNSQTKNARDDSNNNWRAMRTFCDKHSNFLSSREKEFIADIKHWRGALTHKQHHWLVAIFERVQRRAA